MVKMVNYLKIVFVGITYIKQWNILMMISTYFLLFTGGSREGDDNKKDVSWLKDNLKGSNFFYSGVKTTLEDFALIKNCDHNIMSHSSSFGWWAAYLNDNPN